MISFSPWNVGHVNKILVVVVPLSEYLKEILIMSSCVTDSVFVILLVILDDPLVHVECKCIAILKVDHCVLKLESEFLTPTYISYFILSSVIIKD